MTCPACSGYLRHSPDAHGVEVICDRCGKVWAEKDLKGGGRMNCSCSCEMGESPSFCNVTNPKAAKDYKCCECGDVINKGDRYEYVNGAWNGEIGAFKTCLTCSRVREDYARGCAYGYLWEAIGECFGYEFSP